MKNYIFIGFLLLVFAAIGSSSASAISLGAFKSPDLTAQRSQVSFDFQSLTGLDRVGSPQAINFNELAAVNNYGVVGYEEIGYQTDIATDPYSSSTTYSAPMMGTPYNPTHRPHDRTHHSQPDDYCDPGTDPTSVPEPASLLLFGLGLAGAGVVKRMRKNA